MKTDGGEPPQEGDAGGAGGPGGAGGIGVPEPPRENLQRKFAVPKRRMRVVRDWMTSTLSPSEAKQLRESFLPSFSDTGFDLKCPQVDSSLSRRFKDFKCPEMSKAEATEKTLKAEQYKVLDVARPILYLKELIAEEELQNSPMAEAVDVALRLWGHTFHGITANHRENLLKVSDPKFVL
jgi:hypothetical protein